MKFYLETYGCKLNQADSDLIRGVLLEEFEEVPSSFKEGADFFVINSCGVLGKTERKIWKRIKELKKKGKKVILAGCLPLISPRLSEKLADGVIGPKDIFSVSEAARAVLSGKKMKIITKKGINKAKFCFLKVKEDDCSIIISVSEGCLGNCSYCAAKLARGDLKSFELKDILNKIKTALSLGFREIHLTGQDLACYGLDKGNFLLPKLLAEIVKLEGDFRVKVGMLEPYFLKRILKDLIPIFQNEKIYNFFHIPLQSGNDLILEKMRRKYKSKDFLEIATVLKKNFKDYLLATDIIVGFPGETEKAFESTLKIIRKTKPQVLNINRFSARPGTEAFNLKDLPDRIKKERSRLLNKLSEKIKIEKNKKYLGKEFKVLIVKKGKNNTFLARNEIAKAIVLPDNFVSDAKIGEFIKVRIFDYQPHYLIAI